MPRSIVAFLLLVSSASSAGAASIGLFSDGTCASCNLPVPVPPGTATFYVRLTTEGLPQYIVDGVTGVGFRIEGLPPAWIALSTTPTPASNVHVGDPFSADGVAMAFPRAGVTDCELLYTCVVIPIPVGSSAILHVSGQSLAGCWAPPPACPMVVWAPFEYECVCVDGGSLYINLPNDCTVGARAATWSQVKTLYD